MADCMAEIRKGSEKGRIWAQGTARVGEHYQVKRVPVIKKQAISAYDPRVVEATGITMMATAQGADHTAGNLPRLKTREMQAPAIVEQSVAHQARIAANDSLGLCIFGMSVTNPEHRVASPTRSTRPTAPASPRPSSTPWAGRRSSSSTSSTEQAGFTAKDDELPAFFYTEALPPTNHVARFHAADVQGMYERLPA